MGVTDDLKKMKTKGSINMSKLDIISAMTQCGNCNRNISTAVNSIGNSVKINGLDGALSRIKNINSKRSSHISEMKSMVEGMAKSLK